MRIEGLNKYQAVGRGKFFADLTSAQHADALQWLRRFIDGRRAQGLPLQPWLRAIYYGQAKRLALSPPSDEWGRSMRAKKGWYAVQRKYRLEGRNPTAQALAARAQHRQKAVSFDRPTPLEPQTHRGGFPPPHIVVTVYRGQPLPGKW